MIYRSQSTIHCTNYSPFIVYCCVILLCDIVVWCMVPSADTQWVHGKTSCIFCGTGRRCWNWHSTIRGQQRHGRRTGQLLLTPESVHCMSLLVIPHDIGFMESYRNPKNVSDVKIYKNDRQLPIGFYLPSKSYTLNIINPISTWTELIQERRLWHWPHIHENVPRHQWSKQR